MATTTKTARGKKAPVAPKAPAPKPAAEPKPAATPITAVAASVAEPTFYIDPTIADNVTAEEKAIIENLGLRVRDDRGHYHVTDPVLVDRYAKRKPGTAGYEKGVSTGGNLRQILNGALHWRAESDAMHAPATPAPANGNGNGQDEPAAKAGKTKKGNGPAPEIKGAVLDQTGKRETKSAEKKERVKKDGRYLRVARVILASEKPLTVKQVATDAPVSEASVPYCVEAFFDVVRALEDGGFLVKAKIAELTARRPAAAKKS